MRSENEQTRDGITGLTSSNHTYCRELCCKNTIMTSALLRRLQPVPHHEDGHCSSAIPQTGQAEVTTRLQDSSTALVALQQSRQAEMADLASEKILAVDWLCC